LVAKDAMVRESSEAREEVWAALMRAALAGDEQAYRRLLSEVGRVVRPFIRGAFARARLSDADTEDVVQETLLAIHLKRQTWDQSQKLTPWINAIARHKAIDAMRRRGARRVEPIEDFEAFIAAPEPQDPHTRSDVERMMEQLSPRARDIVRSISLEEQTITATAARLGMNEVAVRVALHRALKSLADAWKATQA
jgi:RNA polymerase sigma-70 factor, ECF subfamily